MEMPAPWFTYLRTIFTGGMVMCFNPIRSRGGGNIAPPPPDFWQELQQKLEESVTWIFLTFPKYVYTLTSKKKIVIWTLTGLLRGVLNWRVKIFSAYFGNIYILYDVLFWFCHVRCLYIHKFGHIFHFGTENFVDEFWPTYYLPAVFWPYITGHFISCVIVR